MHLCLRDTPVPVCTNPQASTCSVAAGGATLSPSGKEAGMERSNSSPVPDQTHFYYSKRKIYIALLKGTIILSIFVPLLFFNHSQGWNSEDFYRLSHGDIRTFLSSNATKYFLVLFVIPLWAFIYRPLRQLSKLSEPVVTMSRDGVARKGRAPIPWNTIKNVTFVRSSTLGITVWSFIRIKTSSSFWPKIIRSDTLQLSRDEYNKHSLIYSRRALHRVSP
jgi:hypothetical protein